jgi:5-methyltetrahydropteroyltriglutamate--homocysteine methyltransferase
MTFSANLGFPRIGPHRELKTAVEGFWKGKVTAAQLARTASELRRAAWAFQKDAGLDLIPANDFSLYDHVLDMTALLGAVPPRYHWKGGQVDLDTYFAMARGAQREGLDVTAMEMTKWFDTNYHYIVPEFHEGQTFALSSEKPFAEFKEAAQAAGRERVKPVLLGPLSYVLLGKAKSGKVSPLHDVLPKILPVYEEITARFAKAGAAWLQFDEPCLVQDRNAGELQALQNAYARIAAARGAMKLWVQTYFGHAGDSYETLVNLPVQAVGLDFVRGARNSDFVRQKGFPADKLLAAGVVDGRNIWLNHLENSLALLRELAGHAKGGLAVTPSCSLLHVPYDVSEERDLDVELRSWLAFARQKVQEVVRLARALDGERDEAFFATNAAALKSRAESPRTRHAGVRERMARTGEAEARRGLPAAERLKLQQKRLNLPAFPTTTIGSFPQTAEVRQARHRFRAGEMTEKDYEKFLQEKTREVIRLQEDIGLDVLVHGEFERNDMVEYFGEFLEGFAFTRNGWVQSYGSRCVKPPVVFGDVLRPAPMTVSWSAFAQAQTLKPMKGMLTGPVTILNWSFVRDDIPRSETCVQIALAIRGEAADLEKAGIRVIQIDEPALREGLPLRRGEWQSYLDWAVRCFRVASSGVRDDTQIHTHMCYSEFGDIIQAISDLDADVISIENSRSDLELLRVFRNFRYDKHIGPGVYDIHSPRVPSAGEMQRNLEAAAGVLPPANLWVNPDCGLKTRGTEETVPSLRNMVEAARRMRQAG